jgi:predicted phage-related endonuclease
MAQWGLALEPVIAKEYADVHGVSLILGVKTVSAKEPWMSATGDRLVIANWGDKFAAPDRIDRGLELKNRSAHQSHLFGEPGTDIVPMDIAAQCHWSMEVYGLEVWDVAVLIGGNYFTWYRLHRDEDIIAALMEKGHDFWHNHVLKRVPPPADGSEAYTEYLKKTFAKHTEVMLEANEDIAESIHMLNHRKKGLKDLETEIRHRENELKFLIGDAAGIIAPDGTKATWKKDKDSVGTDYQAVAFELAVKAGLSLEAQQELVKKHEVVTRVGSRKLRITVPKEK